MVICLRLINQDGLYAYAYRISELHMKSTFH